MNETNFFEKHSQEMRQLQKEAPELVKNFGSFFVSVMKEGALSTKTKELIALAIGLDERCEPCIRVHVQKAMAAGCTKDEIMETASVVVLMRGGPAYTHLPLILETIEMCKKESSF